MKPSIPILLAFLVASLICLLSRPSSAAPSARLTDLVVQTNGTVALRFDGSEPGPYALEVSVNLVQWTPVATNAWQNGVVRFVDNGADGQPHRFFRVRFAGPPYVWGEVLVRFKNRLPLTTITNILMSNAVARVTSIIDSPTMQVDGLTPIFVAATSLSVTDAVARLTLQENVAYAHPNWLYQFCTLPDDPKFKDGSLWGLGGGFGCRAADAWQQFDPGHEALPPVYVGLIDTGVQIAHPDLAQNISPPPVSTNFFGNNSNVYDAANLDWHGTYMAGTIGAVGSNNLGVVGVNWRTRIIVCKVGIQQAVSSGSTNVAGLNSVQVNRAFVHLVNLRNTQGLRIVAINCSWGLAGPFDQSLFSSIVHAADHDILTVAAAGNGNGTAGFDTSQPGNEHYPSGYDTTPNKGYNSVISVAALKQDGARWEHSNYGVTSVHLGAPGSNVWTTDTFISPQTDHYTSADGTSLAAAHVTGAVALYASTHPNVTAIQIKQALLNAAVLTPSLMGKTSTGRRLDLSTVINPVSPLCPDVWVDIAYTGLNPNGTSTRPFRMIAQGHQAAVACTTTIHIRAGAYPELPLLLDKPVLFVPEGGPVSIGP